MIVERGIIRSINVHSMHKGEVLSFLGVTIEKPSIDTQVYFLACRILHSAYTIVFLYKLLVYMGFNFIVTHVVIYVPNEESNPRGGHLE